MLKLFTDTSHLTEQHRRQVFPLLFDVWYMKNDELKSFYTLTNCVETCDYCVLPLDYGYYLKENRSFLFDFIKKASSNNKPIWIYTSGDYGFTNYISNSFTFRLGGFHSKLALSTFIFPSFINDPYLSVLPQGFLVLKKTASPTIGFVGHAQLGFTKGLKELIAHIKFLVKRQLKFIYADTQPFYPSSIKRAKYLYKLRNSSSLDTDFVYRTTYRAGAVTEEEKQKTTQEFYANIYCNAYTFCMRGVGNFSVRFYETLAMGRIPILLNTDCRLPFEDIVDWNAHCLILNSNSDETIENQILRFHQSLSQQEFEALQKANRELWLNKLERVAYFKSIIPYFQP